MLAHRAINKLLVVNAAAQGETIEDVLIAYRAASLPRRRAVQGGRGGEARPGARRADPPQAQGASAWPTASACPRTGTACRRRRWCSARCAAAPATAWRMDAGDVNLVFAGLRAAPPPPARGPRLTPRRRAAPTAHARLRPPAPPPRPPTRPHGLRRLFAGRAARFMPLVSNPHVAFAGVMLERLTTRASPSMGLHTLVVDAADSAPRAARAGRARPGAPASSRCRRRCRYLAARGLPLRHVDTRGSTRRLPRRRCRRRAAGRRGAGACRRDRPGAAVRAGRAAAPAAAGRRPARQRDPRLRRR